MSTVAKFLHFPDVSQSGKAMYRPAIALRCMAGKAWEAASPIVVKGCLAAMVHPSPTTGFIIGVALEIGRLLLRTPVMEAVLVESGSYRPASWTPPAQTGVHALNDDMEMHDEHFEQ